MKLYKIFIFFLTISTVCYGEDTIFVKENASGLNNGTSWLNAFNDLEDALSNSTNGDVIWVAAGTYKPGKNIPARTSSFLLNSGISIFGGFSGIESSISERNYLTNVTILSGEIGSAGMEDNCYHVISTNGTDTTQFLDGFFIRDGNANINSTLTHSGGGVNLPGTNSISVRNCVFSYCYAIRGSGIYCEQGYLNIYNCTFSNNNAVNAAGVYGQSAGLKIYNCQFTDNSASGQSTAVSSGRFMILNDCLFENNINTSIGSGGGAVLCSEYFEIRKSSFIGNSAYNGTAITCSNTSYLDYRIIDSCSFVRNTATQYGAAVYNSSNTQISNCTFSNNSSYGGAIHCQGINKNTRIINCEFSNNAGVNVFGGGAITKLYDCSIYIKNCKFSGNRAGHGGAILLTQGKQKSIIEDCEFTGNIANAKGGAISVDKCDAIISRCKFFNDTANIGGAIALVDSNQIVKNCVFANNYSINEGGAIYNSQNTFRVINSTIFKNNTSIFSGGGIYNDYYSNGELTNTILWKNKARNTTNISAQIVNKNSATYIASFCIIESLSLSGLGNMNIDPWFRDTINNDLRLYKCSPAINSGIEDTSGLMLSTIDLSGNARILENRIDIGAFEEAMGNNAPDISDQFFNIDENSAGGIVIGNLFSVDLDSPPQMLNYTIISGNDNDTFDLNSTTGEIKLLKNLDYEIYNQYELVVRVSDNCTNNLFSDQARIIINVNDLAEIPSLITSPIHNITTTDAYSGGELLNDGGENIFVKGICWSTSPNPTISDSKTIDGTGTDSYTSSLTGLAQNTTYYVRAYATNSQGTAYGNEISFTTGTSTGINSGLFSQDVEIYPNPNEGLFSLHIKGLKNTELEIKVVNNKEVTVVKETMKQVNGDYTNKIDLSSLAKGIYYMEIITNQGSRIEKIVVQ